MVDGVRSLIGRGSYIMKCHTLSHARRGVQSWQHDDLIWYNFVCHFRYMRLRLCHDSSLVKGDCLPKKEAIGCYCVRLFFFGHWVLDIRMYDG